MAAVPTERFQEELQAHHLPTDHVTSPYTSLLIDTGSHKVLIDTGAGSPPRTATCSRTCAPPGSPR